MRTALSAHPRIRRLAAGACLAALALGALHAGSAHAVATKAAATPKAGRWVGFAGGFTVDFKVSANRKTITGLTTDYQATEGCGAPSNNVITTRFPAVVIRDGRFDASVTRIPPSGLAMHYTVVGRFSTPTKVSGSVSDDFNFPHNSEPPCRSSNTFSGTRAGK
jgi:hypothetical protein